ncbi:MAG: YceI family protein [Candidatus Latescibacteria bacterium]|jgi:polyisoprenoid-binding protein YceI|nr:polyisoprenoid-binding protein [Gemmatimonadaceae bacterium]MDP6014879.1 YceI family protein [Candidatus Latescibacterota bacterium]
MNRFARRTTLAGVLLLAGIVDAETYQVDATHSAVDFAIRHMVGRTKGRFGEFSGTVVYDAARPTATSISGTIQTNSINTDNKKRDKHLRSEDFFHVEAHPTMVFESTKAVLESGDLLHVTGNLAMRGVTKQVVLVVEILGTGINPMNQKQQVGLATEFTLKRSDYGVNHWSDTAGVLGDDVKVSINIEANAG